MKEDIVEKFRALFRDEIARMVAKGATEADMQEEAFDEMIARNVARQVYDLVQQLDAEDRQEVWLDYFQRVSVNKLREVAAKLRGKRSADAADAAYDLEYLADLRERGEA